MIFTQTINFKIMSNESSLLGEYSFEKANILFLEISTHMGKKTNMPTDLLYI